MVNIAIFASGTGSNAINIINFFDQHEQIRVKILACNKADAPVLELTKNMNVEQYVFSKSDLNSGLVEQKMQDSGVDFIVLAGFLWLIPASLTKTYEDKIINIHPSLLPKFGGKGMYGKHVHRAVAAAKEKETGITIHLVNSKYDDGEVLAQEKVTLSNLDDAESIERKVRELELEHYPRVIEKTLLRYDEI